MRVPVLAITALALLAGAARADGFVTTVTPVEPGPTGWHFQFTPYAWLPWMDGDAVVRGRQFDVNQNPGQVLDTLDFAFMGYMQARRGAITLYTDIVYSDNTNSGDFARSKTFSPHVAGSIGGVVSADFQQWIAEFGGLYETNRFRVGPGYGDPNLLLDMGGGIRYWHQDLDVNVALAGTVNVDGLITTGSGALARSGGVNWVDPFIGARLTYLHSPTESFVVRGDIGGFSIGSRFTWQAVATYNFYLGSHAAIDYDGYLGWRALSVDYVKGRGAARYEYDVLEQGPVIGITGKF